MKAMFDLHASHPLEPGLEAHAGQCDGGLNARDLVLVGLIAP